MLIEANGLYDKNHGEGNKRIYEQGEQRRTTI